MNYQVICPKCKAINSVDTDDGLNCEDSETSITECFSCEEEFEVSTTVSISHNAYCKDGDHSLTAPYGNDPNYTFCDDCGSCQETPKELLK